MNKQEAIEKLKSKAKPHWLDEEIYGDSCIKSVELCMAIEIVNQIDKPEKPVVPQYVADWIEWCKRNKVSLLGGFSAIDELGLAICNDKKVKSLEASKWATRNQETFAQAWLFGYEVEKEKLYTAKLKLTNEYLCYRPRFNALLHCIVPETTAKEIKVYHFTEDVLVKYHVWGNDTYEVTEVEE